MPYRKEKRFTFLVTEPDKLVESTLTEFNLEKDAVAIKGICLSSDWPDFLYYRGTFGLELSGRELFAEGFEAKKLMFSMATGMNDRLARVESPVGDGRIKVKFKDSDHPRANWADLPGGYKVHLYLDLEYGDN